MDWSTVIGGIGGNLINNAIQYYTQKNQQKQAQANTRKNMKEQAELEDVSWYNRIANSTAALKAAGLSPVLATGQTQGAAAVSHSEGMPQVGTPSGGVDLVNAAMLNNSQKELNEAAAKKANAEAEATEIKNRHAEHQDFALSVGMRDMVTEMRDSTDNPFMRGFLDSYLDATSGEYNLGDYEAFNKMWFDFSQKERDRELNFIQTEFDKRVLQMQFENGAAAAVADMPKAKRYELYASINQMNANIARLNAETALTVDQRDKIRAEIGKLGQEVLHLLHSDPAAMYNAGDTMSLLVGLGYDALKGISTGAGFAIGAKALGKGAGNPASAGVSPSNVARQVNLSRQQINARGAAAEAARRNVEAGARYREEKALRERLQRNRSTDYMR